MGAETIVKGAVWWKPWRDSAIATILPKESREEIHCFSLPPTSQFLTPASCWSTLSGDGLAREPGQCSLQGSATVIQHRAGNGKNGSEGKALWGRQLRTTVGGSGLRVRPCRQEKGGR